MIAHALVSVSHELVTSARVDLRGVLRVIADALGASCGYLALAAADAAAPLPVPEALAGALVLWCRDGGEDAWLVREGTRTRDTLAGLQARVAPAPAASPNGAPSGAPPAEPPADALGIADRLALPLLSEDDLFLGYLGIEGLAERPAPATERMLHVFGDLLAAYLTRRAAEEALRRSEQRWHHLVDRLPEAMIVTRDDAVLYANKAAAALLGLPSPARLAGRAFSDFLPAEQVHEVERHRARHLAAADGGRRASSPHEHDLIRIDGEERTVESVSAPAPFHGAGAVQTMLRDVTERRLDEERYRAFFETISEGVWRIDLDAPLLRLAPPDAHAEHILTHGHLADCNDAMVRLLQAPHTGALVGRPLAELDWGLTRDLLVQFARSGFQLHNAETSARAGSAPRHFALNAVGRFDRGQLVGLWGSCVDVTDRVEMERRMVAALEEQQERIGRDLHDSVGQLLTGVRMLSENLAARYFEGNEAGRVTAQRVTAYADEALQRVRSICRGLVPPQLYQDGLALALAELASQLDALSDVRCTFTHDGRTDVRDGDAGLQLFRIAQEAASNALKHAAASRIWVHLTTEDGLLTLEVEDNGRGFLLERAGRSIGLYSMQRRASSIRAALAIETRPGAGTTVRVSLAPGTLAPEASPPNP